MNTLRSPLSLLITCIALLAMALPAPRAAASDMTIVAANLVPGANAQYRYGVAGVAITAGQLVYLDATTNTYKLSDANDSLTVSDVDGIAANSAGAGQPLSIITSDDNLKVGGVTVKGVIYILSATPGAIAAAGDLTTGWYAVVIGVGIDTTHMLFRAEGLRNKIAQ